MQYVVDVALLLWILDEFKRRNFTEILVVYDYDDILWSLMEVVCLRLGISYQRATAFYKIRENPLLSHEEQEAIIAAFADASFFQNIQFYPGVKDIAQIMQLGAKLEINSNSFNQKIADFKTEQLLAVVPDLRPEQIRMNIINHSQAHCKPLNPQMTLFYDDSPYNILLSRAVLNGIPSQMRWSNQPDALRRYQQQHKCVWPCDNLQAMNQLAYQVVEFIVKEGYVHA